MAPRFWATAHPNSYAWIVDDLRIGVEPPELAALRSMTRLAARPRPAYWSDCA